MKNIFFLFLLLNSLVLYSQSTDDERLAIQYYQLHEYSKAEVLLKNLYLSQPEKFHEYLIQTYFKLKKYDEAISITEEILKLNNRKLTISELELRYKLGLAYFKKNDSNQAKKEWVKSIHMLKDNEFEAQYLVAKLNEVNQFQLSEETIYQFQKKSNDKSALEIQLLELFVSQKKYLKAVEVAFEIIDRNEEMYMAILSNFQFLNESLEALKFMDKKVYSKLNSDPNSDKWNELAMGLSITIKDYEQALTIAKSIDKRKKARSQEVITVAEVAFNEGEYNVAIDAYSYLTFSSNQHISRLGFERKLKTQVKKLESNNLKDSLVLIMLDKEFQAYFDKFSIDNKSSETQLLYAYLKVKHAHDLNSGKMILERLITLPQVTKFNLSRAKLDLADIKLAQDDIWEASLLYGQVDKEEKDNPLGEEARFKNAKVFYYNGDYELAEELLTILKSSTTELIANDALYLAVFIQENSADIALQTAMKDIAKSELLFYQNKPNEAIDLLVSVKNLFSKSNLVDDILNIEASYALRIKNFSLAKLKFKELFEKYPKSILADKALFEWAKIEEEHIKDINLAQANYLELLKTYHDSVYTAEARKRLRALRGDKIEEEL